MLKNRKPIRRKTRLKPGKPPKRSGKELVRKALLKQRKRIRAKGKPRFKRGRDPQYLEWIRGLPCLLLNRIATDGETKGHRHICLSTEIEAAHVRSRGAGGVDVGNVVPLDGFAHSYQHLLGINTWAERWFDGGLAELRRIAAEVYPQHYEAQRALGWPE